MPESQEIVEEVKAPIPDSYAKQLQDAYIEKIKLIAPKEYHDIAINGKSVRFRRRKILNKERFILETLRQKLQAAAATNGKEYPVLEDQLYKKMASFFLIDAETQTPMSTEQYDEIPFEDLKIILDALNFRTERPIPIPTPLENL